MELIDRREILGHQPLEVLARGHERIQDRRFQVAPRVMPRDPLFDIVSHVPSSQSLLVCRTVRSGPALRWFRQVMAFDSLRHTAFIGIGCAHFAAGRYERAALWAQSGVEAFPASFWGERIVVAAAVHAGARAEARRTARRLLRKDPDLTVAVARQAWPFRPDFMERLADGPGNRGHPARMRLPSAALPSGGSGRPAGARKPRGPRRGQGSPAPAAKAPVQLQVDAAGAAIDRRRLTALDCPSQ